MNIYKITSLIALATIFTSSLVGAAELRNPLLQRSQSNFEVSKKVVPRKLEIKKSTSIIVNQRVTCVRMATVASCL